MRLHDYISKFYGGNQRRFAEAARVRPQQVTQWLAKDMVVIDGKLYSYRRDLPKT